VTSLAGIPKRIFLDSSVLQTMHDYGEFLWDGGEITPNNPIWTIPDGIENLNALRNFIFVQQRLSLELALSAYSFTEVLAKGDSSYLNWAYEILAYWQALLDEYSTPIFTGKGVELAQKLDKPSFGYLGTGDRRLIQDAVKLECDVFLTVERRLPKNKAHIKKELGISILTPIPLWVTIEPWAAMFV